MGSSHDWTEEGGPERYETGGTPNYETICSIFQKKWREKAGAMIASRIASICRAKREQGNGIPHVMQSFMVVQIRVRLLTILTVYQGQKEEGLWA